MAKATAVIPRSAETPWGPWSAPIHNDAEPVLRRTSIWLGKSASVGQKKALEGGLDAWYTPASRCTNNVTQPGVEALVLRYRLLTAVLLGLVLGVIASDSLVRSKLTPGTRHFTVQLWSFPVYEEDQSVRQMDDGSINISLEEPLFAHMLRSGVVLVFIGVGVFTAYGFGYRVLLWVLVVLLLAVGVPGIIVRSNWSVGSRDVTVDVLFFRVYETDNGFGVNNEDWRGAFREPTVALMWRLALALLIIGVGVLAAMVLQMRRRQAC